MPSWLSASQWAITVCLPIGASGPIQPSGPYCLSSARWLYREWRSTGPRPHIKHHARADREGDPHSPVDGFFHAHLGWIFGDGEANPAQYCRHLLHDRLVIAVSRMFLLWAALSLAIPFAVGFLAGGWLLAWTSLLWGGLVRMFLTHHVTWSVNSVCHTFGKREYATPDRSRNE